MSSWRGGEEVRGPFPSRTFLDPGLRASSSPCHCLLLLALTACADLTEPIDIDLAAADDEAAITRRFEIAGTRTIDVHLDRPLVIEGWVDGATFDAVSEDQLQAGGSPRWIVPHVETGDLSLTVAGDGEVTLSLFTRGTPPPTVDRARSLAWFDSALLDDPSVISFARVMAAIADDGHGGRLLQRWFEAFAAGPGAGRAAFAQFVDDVATAQGPDPTQWDLGALPFRVTGVHNRHDLGRGVDCGELRVSVASSDPVFAPVHLIFLFRAPVGDDDVTPDGAVHCRGAALRWARLTGLSGDAWKSAARDLLAATLVRDRFLLAESVELSISPWQWRQWQPDDAGGLVNPPLFQTVDVALVTAPGPLRDAFLADVAANRDAIAARGWPVPSRYRSAVAEVQPNEKAPLVDVGSSELSRALGMIGCPRCHTDNADFIQTSFDRKASPFYERELDARAARLDALDAGEFPPPVAFGPLQSL
jgi:hypothetical protein